MIQSILFAYLQDWRRRICWHEGHHHMPGSQLTPLYIWDLSMRSDEQCGECTEHGVQISRTPPLAYCIYAAISDLACFNSSVRVGFQTWQRFRGKQVLINQFLVLQVKHVGGLKRTGRLLCILFVAITNNN